MPTGSRNLGGVSRLLDRRTFLVGTAATVLAGCNTTMSREGLRPASFNPVPGGYYQEMYAAIPDEKFPIPAVDVTRVDPRYLRQEIAYGTPEPAGTIIVDTSEKFLYLVRENGRALRYGVGVGRQGLTWSGRGMILHKAAWPRWTPTENMIARDPELAKYADGMEPGLNNPLGARALYLFEGGRDTLYRLHGTNEPHSIGQAMSSGCIRLFNQDIIDLYNRTPIGTRVVVLDHETTPSDLTV